MRPIKFRAWDKDLGKWVTDRILLQANGEIFFQGTGEELHTHDIDIVFFIGLLDKNGKEIYEGDIVKDHIHIPHEVKIPNIYGELSGGGDKFPWYCGDTLEVIGNIYENKELW